jgi:hypothetical protein
MSAPSSPVHKHDCDCCIYLGTVEDGTAEKGFADLYAHVRHADDRAVCLIRRTGSDGPEYVSATYTYEGWQSRLKDEWMRDSFRDAFFLADDKRLWDEKWFLAGTVLGETEREACVLNGRPVECGWGAVNLYVNRDGERFIVEWLEMGRDPKDGYLGHVSQDEIIDGINGLDAVLAKVAAYCAEDVFSQTDEGFALRMAINTAKSETDYDEGVHGDNKPEVLRAAEAAYQAHLQRFASGYRLPEEDVARLREGLKKIGYHEPSASLWVVGVSFLDDSNPSSLEADGCVADYRAVAEKLGLTLWQANMLMDRVANDFWRKGIRPNAERSMNPASVVAVVLGRSEGEIEAIQPGIWSMKEDIQRQVDRLVPRAQKAPAGPFDDLGLIAKALFDRCCTEETYTDDTDAETECEQATWDDMLVEIEALASLYGISVSEEQLDEIYRMMNKFNEEEKNRADDYLSDIREEGMRNYEASKLRR